MTARAFETPRASYEQASRLRQARAFHVSPPFHVSAAARGAWLERMFWTATTIIALQRAQSFTNQIGPRGLLCQTGFSMPSTRLHARQ
eukprot:7102589-Alexandrium_andersonii.AAC.1